MGWSLDRYNRRALLFAESSLYVLSNIIQIFVASKEGVWVRAPGGLCPTCSPPDLPPPTTSDANAPLLCASPSPLCFRLQAFWLFNSFADGMQLVALNR